MRESDNGYPEPLAPFPNIYAGVEYPRNFVFCKPPGEVGEVVGYSWVQLLAANETIKILRYDLVWNGEFVDEQLIGKKNGQGNG